MCERNFRRRGWTRGLPITLADGFTWYFPQIDFSLMAVTSGLQHQMVEVFRLARETQYEIDGVTHKLKTALYHTQMSILAVMLLRLNYEMEDSRWEEMTMFGSLAELVAFSEETSLIFFDTSEVWMPFLTTCGTEGREVLALN